METKIKLPQMGEGVIEAQIGNWLKKVGDRVKINDPLVEAETDKVTTELVSDYDGVLTKIVAKTGQTVAVGAVLAIIEEKGDSGKRVVSEEWKVESKSPNLPQSSPRPQPPTPSPYLSPVVKRIVKEHNLDVSQIIGTGKNGRITKRDCLKVVESGEWRVESEEQSPSPVPNPQSLIPISAMRRKIAEHMILSKQVSPHATTVWEVDLSAVSTHRTTAKPQFAQQNVRLTYLAYIAEAVIVALKKVPLVNSSWTDNGIQLHPHINLGIATAIESGLVVPVIHGADGLNLLGLAKGIGISADKARTNKLTPSDLQNGTFTLNNHGVSGSLLATPIINQPQAAILGVGAIEKRVCVIDDMIAIRPKAYFSLSFDHRILDGANADEFMRAIKIFLEGYEVRKLGS